MPNLMNVVIGTVISLPISIVLLVWMLHYKKDRKFPRWSVVIMLVGGAVSAGFAMLAGMGIQQLARLIGGQAVDGVSALTAETTAQGAVGMQVFNAAFGAFVIAALCEEVFKFLAMVLASKRRGTIRNLFDAVLCGAIVGLGFEILEDIIYAVDAVSVVATVVRALTPFHFLFGALMGYFYGKAKMTGKKGYYVPALLIPILVHGLYDFGNALMPMNDLLFGLFLLLTLVMDAFTIVMIVRIHKWSKSEQMLAPTEFYQKAK